MIAGLQSLPEEVIEAARMDGASAWTLVLARDRAAHVADDLLRRGDRRRSPRCRASARSTSSSATGQVVYTHTNVLINYIYDSIFYDRNFGDRGVPVDRAVPHHAALHRRAVPRPRAEGPLWPLTSALADELPGAAARVVEAGVARRIAEASGPTSGLGVRSLIVLLPGLRDGRRLAAQADQLVANPPVLFPTHPQFSNYSSSAFTTFDMGVYLRELGHPDGHHRDRPAGDLDPRRLRLRVPALPVPPDPLPRRPRHRDDPLRDHRLGQLHRRCETSAGTTTSSA